MLAFGIGVIRFVATAQAQPLAAANAGTHSETAPRRPGPPLPALRLGNSGSAPLGVLQVTAVSGEALLHKKPGDASAQPAELLRPATVLAAHDEISTAQGSVELSSASGVSLRLGPSSLLALLAPNAVYLARGEVDISSHPSAGPLPPGATTPNLPTMYVATQCGRSAIRARTAHLRLDGPATVVAVYDGLAFLGGYPPTGVVVTAGQWNRCVKGQPISAARPIVPAPQWTSGSELILVGDGGSPTEVTLRWQPVAMAQRYQVELYRSSDDSTPPLATLDVPAARPQVELRELDAGSYLARVFTIDENGMRSQESLPHHFLLARVGGMGLDGTIKVEPGVLPRINGPTGLPIALLLDEQIPKAAALTPGAHKLRVTIAGLGAEAPLWVSGSSTVQQSSTTAAAAAPVDGAKEAEEPAAVSPKAAQRTPAAGAADSAAPATGEAVAPKSSAAFMLDGIGQEDLQLGGVGEVPFEGIRSPWAGTYVGTRLETTMSGSLRVALSGRWTMKNGFGFDGSVGLLRVALGNVPAGYSPAGFGNLNAGVRTPALRLKHLALQGVLGMLVPISTSFLDTSVEVDPQYASAAAGGTTLHPEVRSRGGGWRIEPGVLLGIRFRNFTLSTLQGASFRVAPNLGAAYAGGLLLHLEILKALRFMSFASWQVNYLGVAVNANGATPDIGGALGAGLEGLVRVGTRGQLRLAAVGRVGIGDAGAAIYGRGALGLQVGYLFY